MNIPINVWYYNDKAKYWTLKETGDFQETTDENKYFRVIFACKKHFYSSPDDYVKHNEKNIIIDNFIDDNENTNKSYLTDVNNNVIIIK